MATTPSSDPRIDMVRRRTAAWITSAGIGVVGVAAAVALSWRSQLPDPVASHWGVGGTADGFSSLNGLLAVMLGFGTALVLAFGAVTLLLGQSAVTRRIGAASAAWSALFVSLLILGSLYIQRGLADARDVGGIGTVLLVAIIGSLMPAIAVGALIPGDPTVPAREAVAADAPRAKLAAGDRTTWLAYTDAGPAAGIALITAAMITALVIVTRVWSMLIVVGVLGILIVSMFRWVVRVDSAGLDVRSAIGWPRTRVPLDEVVRADVIQVRALRDYGGWGLRVGREGRVGVVLRSGEALVVQRSGGRSVAVTVEGAAAGAALLNTLADRARSR